MSQIEITCPAYKLRRDELDGFTLSDTYTDTTELIFPPGFTPGFVEIVTHNENQAKTVNISPAIFIGFPKTKTEKIWRMNYYCTVFTQRDNPHNTVNVFREHNSIPKKNPLTRFSFLVTSVVEDVCTDRVFILGI